MVVNVTESSVAHSSVSRITSIRQRSRSGDTSPVSQSPHDIVASGNVAVAVAMSSSVVSNGSGIVRSSSDSNILLDTDKHKGQSLI